LRIKVYHTFMPRVAPVVPDESDLLCEGCGYTLKGLPLTGNCPECGKPIQQSVGHHRLPIEWENWQRRSFRIFVRTTLAVIFRPAHFFQTLQTRRLNSGDSTFALIHWIIVSLLFACVAIAHLLNLTVSARPALGMWLGLIPLLALVILWLLALLTLLAAKLTQWEAAYRGIRLPMRVVLRGLYYHAAHYLPVATLAQVLVMGYRILLWLGILHHSDDIMYLWTLCAAVIVCAFYLFWTYWIAMRNMMFANR
jgi:hypothetical protein